MNGRSETAGKETFSSAMPRVTDKLSSVVLLSWLTTAAASCKVPKVTWASTMILADVMLSRTLSTLTLSRAASACVKACSLKEDTSAATVKLTLRIGAQKEPPGDRSGERGSGGGEARRVDGICRAGGEARG